MPKRQNTKWIIKGRAKLWWCNHHRKYEPRRGFAGQGELPTASSCNEAIRLRASARRERRRRGYATHETYCEIVERFQDWCSRRKLSFTYAAGQMMRLAMAAEVDPEGPAIEFQILRPK